MNIYKKIAIVLILIIIFIYVCNITMFPDSIILIQGEEININTVLGLQIKNKSTLEASSSLNEKLTDEAGQKDLELTLFNVISLKDVTVDVIPKTTVIPIGKAIGMELYTEGVLVVGMSEIEGEKPYEDTGIETGDRIIEVAGQTVSTTEELIECVNTSEGKTIEIKYINSDDEIVSAQIEPAKTSDNEYKIGLWVRDAAAGVGTLTFYEPSTGSFGSLGHGINDVDTSTLIDIASGNLVTTEIVEIVKGEDGSPRRNKREHRQ